MRGGAPPCSRLEWDSEFFGCRIGRVAAHRITSAEMERVLDWARVEVIDCLYFLAEAADLESVRIAEEAGFDLTDVRVTRIRDLDASGESPPDDVDLYREEDLPALRAIASVSHRDTRFYHDPHFPRARCDALYASWITRRCAESPNGVLVVRDAGVAAGYLTCLIDPDGVGIIDLVAVAPEQREKGLGERLVRASFGWFAERGCSRVRVVSQARNAAAARVYRRLGFRTVSLQLWYHPWLAGSPLADAE